MGLSLKEIRNFFSVIVREKILKADVPYMVEQENFITSKQKNLFIDFLNNSYPKLEFSLLEIGSRGGISSNWKPLLKLRSFHLEGVEPDKKEAEAIMRQGKIPYKKVHPFAVFSKDTKKILFITKALGCVSLYEPNIEELKCYPNSKKFEVQKKKLIEVKKLGSIILSERTFDYLNFDIQGAEYEALLGAKRILKDVVGLSLETHFFEYYKGQKLFPEVHNLLKKNFRLLKFNVRMLGGQISEMGDTVYVKRHDLVNSEEDLIKRILFCVLFERKKHIELLLENNFKKICPKNLKKIKNILSINIKRSKEVEELSLEKWNNYSFSKGNFDGRGY